MKKGHRGSEGEKQKLVPEGVSATEGDGSEKKKELVHFPDKHDEQQTEPKEKERGKRAKEAKKKEITQKKSLSRLVEDKNRKVVLARFKQALTVKSVYLRVYVLRGKLFSIWS